MPLPIYSFISRRAKYDVGVPYTFRRRRRFFGVSVIFLIRHASFNLVRPISPVLYGAFSIYHQVGWHQNRFLLHIFSYFLSIPECHFRCCICCCYIHPFSHVHLYTCVFFSNISIFHRFFFIASFALSHFYRVACWTINILVDKCCAFKIRRSVWWWRCWCTHAHICTGAKRPKLTFACVKCSLHFFPYSLSLQFPFPFYCCCSAVQNCSCALISENWFFLKERNFCERIRLDTIL